MIMVVGSQLSQWDVGRIVSVSKSNATHVHFANQGDAKAVIIEVVEGLAKIPDYLLQTGKTVVAYAVLDGATLESKSFAVRKRERPENYVYEDDQRNYIYELITNAEKAAADANEAADRANQAAKSWVMMGKVSGESIAIDDAIKQSFAGFRIFGKTTQDGTPTPDAPVDLVSVENPTIMVNDQSALIPYTLHGIPVTSGGNYTDANGRQWLCDEIDFAKGVYIQRVRFKTLNGSEAWKVTANSAGVSLFFHYDNDAGNIIERNGLSSIGYTTYGNIDIGGYGLTYAYHFRLRLETMNPDNATVDELKAYLAANPIDVLVSREKPIETPISAEALAAYSALHTYKDHTTVSNDASAHMELEYSMDAKKYIDSLMAGTILPAAVE